MGEEAFNIEALDHFYTCWQNRHNAVKPTDTIEEQARKFDKALYDMCSYEQNQLTSLRPVPPMESKGVQLIQVLDQCEPPLASAQ